MLHKMDRTPRNLTIIGLVFDAVSVVSLSGFAWVFNHLSSFGVYELIREDVSPSEWTYLLGLFDFLSALLMVLAIITIVLFMISVVLFTRLIKGRYDERKAKKVYLYQAIVGGIYLLFNQVTGIMYLISGVMGYNGHKEMTKKDIREGI